MTKVLILCWAYRDEIDIEMKFLISNYWNHVKNKKYGNLVSISSLTGKWAEKIKKKLQF